MILKNDLVMRFPHRIYRKLTHRYIKLIVMFVVVVLLSIPIFKFYKKNNDDYDLESDFVQVISKIQDFIDKETTRCLGNNKKADKDRAEQNEAFKNIKTNLPIIPLRMTLSTAVYLFDDGKKRFIIKRVILDANSSSQEETISMDVKHENIVKTIYTERRVFVHKKKKYNILWIFLEYLDKSLNLKKINRNPHKIRSIIFDVCKAVKYLHDSHIIHLDIKLSNVMGSTEKYGVVYKLIDFGFSRDLRDDVLTKDEFVYLRKKSYGTFPYKPPEVSLRNKHGKASDIWCIGMMTWFMTKGRIGFRTESGGKDIKSFLELIENDMKIKIPADTDSNLRDFILYALNHDEAKRPTIDDLLEHPFLDVGLASSTNFKYGQKSTD